MRSARRGSSAAGSRSSVRRPRGTRRTPCSRAGSCPGWSTCTATSGWPRTAPSTTARPRSRPSPTATRGCCSSGTPARPADTGWVHDRDDLPRLIRAGRHLARPKRYLRHYGRELESVDRAARRPSARRRRAATAGSSSSRTGSTATSVPRATCARCGPRTCWPTPWPRRTRRAPGSPPTPSRRSLSTRSSTPASTASSTPPVRRPTRSTGSPPPGSRSPRRCSRSGSSRPSPPRARATRCSPRGCARCTPTGTQLVRDLHEAGVPGPRRHGRRRDHRARQDRRRGRGAGPRRASPPATSWPRPAGARARGWAPRASTRARRRISSSSAPTRGRTSGARRTRAVVLRGAVVAGRR